MFWALSWKDFSRRESLLKSINIDFIADGKLIFVVYVSFLVI